MTNLEKLAEDKFQGNKEEAIRDIIENASKEELDKYIEDFTQQEADLFLKFIFKNVKGSKKTMFSEVKKERLLQSLNLTEEEAIKKQKNPYKKKLLKSILSLLLVEAIIVGLCVTMKDSETVNSILEVAAPAVTGLLACDVTRKLIPYLKFRKLKKILLTLKLYESEDIARS